MGSIQHAAELDLSHHLNAKSKARHQSPLKAIIKYMAVEGMISVAGGLPHPSLFPFQNLTIDTFSADTILDAAKPNEAPTKFDTITITKDATPKQPLDLSSFLQYGGGMGNAGLLKWSRDFTQSLFQPAYDSYMTLMHSGNTDAWSKVVGMLCEDGEYVLCEEYSYPSAQANWQPLGCLAAPVKMDESGMRADELERTLANWDTAHPGVKRPHLLYVVPVGSNPCGTTMIGKRRQEIYEICVKYDIIICEDDPYCFLQYTNYEVNATPTKIEPSSPEEFLASLVPSFLKFDTQGRVIRLDTFSKTLAPGCRLGYFVANPLFTEKLLHATQVETQAPSGWSQVITLGLLNQWGTTGYLQWLSNLRDQYRIRRDWMCDAIATQFHVQPATELNIPGAEGLVAFAHSDTTTPLFSFVPPTSGMFIWARLYLDAIPSYQRYLADETCADPEAVCADALWLELCEALVLVAPGSYYIPYEGEGISSVVKRGSGIGHFRLAFSTTTKEELGECLLRMAKVFDSFWKV